MNNEHPQLPGHLGGVHCLWSIHPNPLLKDPVYSNSKVVHSVRQIQIRKLHLMLQMVQGLVNFCQLLGGELGGELGRLSSRRDNILSQGKHLGICMILENIEVFHTALSPSYPKFPGHS